MPKTIEVQTSYGPQTVTPGRLNDAAVDVYIYGQCHALAIALAEHLGAKPYAIVNWNGDEEFRPTGNSRRLLPDKAFSAV
jgi:hypothetical protein